MKLSRFKRIMTAILLLVVLLPVSSAFAGLPGPEPPAPPAVPTPPPDGDFDNVKLHDARGQSDVDLQIEIGTSGKDKIVMYGGKDDINQYSSGLEANDWFLQVGGEKASTQTISGGSGDDTLYQYGGQGYSKQTATGSAGNDTIIQVGGQGDNDMDTYGGFGNDDIEMYGGAGNNSIHCQGGSSGDNAIKLYGGPRNDTMTFKLNSGNHAITVLGGGGHNTLKIRQGDNKQATIMDYQGQVLYKYSDYPDPPSAAPTAFLSEAGGNVTAGTHWVRVAFVTAGGESGAGPPSAPVMADGSHAIDVANIPLGPAGTTARKIYMSRVVDVTPDPCFLAGTLSNNTATTYSISLADDALVSLSLGAATFTVANLNLITIVDPDEKTVWRYSSGAAAVSNAVVPLLLLQGEN